MRRRSSAMPRLDHMERGQGKSQQSRLCLLVLLSGLLWLLLLYFHFVVLGGKTADESQRVNPGSLRSEFSNSWKFSLPSYNVKRPIGFSSPEVDGSVVNEKNGQGGEASSNVQLPVSVDEKNGQGSEALSNAQLPSVNEKNGQDDEASSNVQFPVGNGKNGQGGEASSNVQFALGNEKNGQGGEASTNAQFPLPAISNSKPGKDSSKHNAKNYPFMRALRTVDNKSDPCGGRYIYVHDLPPKFNEDMLEHCRTLSRWTNMCKFTTNAGLGPPLDNAEGVFSETGWHATNQFAVDVIFNNRMKQYECLTNDSSLAAAIFVPFYAGFDIARYLWGYNVSTRDSASVELADWLSKRPEWGIMGGKDHFLVAGRITWDFRRLSDEDSDWGNKLLFLPAAKNMSMLVVESSPWHANDFGIPYPTYFHPAKDADVFVWQDRMRKLDRKWLFCFAGAPRPGNPKSIRGQIISQCKDSKVCKLLECDFGESKCHSPSSIMQMFQSSLFCLQPQGDSYTRRSAFDSILAGCIPVFFHPGSAYTQYTWHLPKNYSKYSVFISENDVRKKNVSIEQLISRIPMEQVKQMREEVINLIPRIIYADPRSKLETLKDAFDLAVQGVINKVTKLRKEIVEDRVDHNFVEELSWKYALLEEGEYIGPHEWDPIFAKQKDGAADSDASTGEAAKKSWQTEQGQHS